MGEYFTMGVRGSVARPRACTGMDRNFRSTSVVVKNSVRKYCKNDDFEHYDFNQSNRATTLTNPIAILKKRCDLL